MPIRYRDQQSRLGQVAGSLSGATGLMQGTFSPAVARTGSIATQLGAATGLFSGNYSTAPNRTGVIGTTLGGATPILVGNGAPIWQASIPDQNLTLNVPFSLDLDTVCDPDSSTYSIVAGALPAGTTFSGSVVSGSPTSAGTFDVTFRADNGASNAQNDWIARSTGPGVVWSNNFDTDAEVNAYRWAGGAGNDPNAASADASYMRRLPSSGPGGLPCLEILRPAARESNVNWWRPFSAMAAGGNGKATADPGAGKPVRTWNPSASVDTTSQWLQDFYGPQTYQQDFYLQIRIQRDPRRVTPAYNAVTYVGKQLFLSLTTNSLTAQEIVTLSGSGGGSGGTTNDFFRMYIAGSPAIEQSDPLGRPGQQIGGDLSTYPSNYCDVTANPGRCWSFSGGWDTILYHVTPGTQTSGNVTSHIRVYAARQGVTTYTKIWDQDFVHQWQTASTKGWNALILNTYQNNLTMPGDFWQRYAQIIFSTQFIPCPQV